MDVVTDGNSNSMLLILPLHMEPSGDCCVLWTYTMYTCINICSTQSRNLCNLQIMLLNLGIPRLSNNLQIVTHSADRTTVATQSADCATVAMRSADVVHLAAKSTDQADSCYALCRLCNSAWPHYLQIRWDSVKMSSIPLLV